METRESINKGNRRSTHIPGDGFNAISIALLYSKNH